MARLPRQREPLESGYVVKTVTVGPVNTFQSVTLQIPGVGSPMGTSGTLRNAPSPWLSLYGGIRPTRDFNPATVSGQVTTLFEIGVNPYVDRSANRPPVRRSRPMYSAWNPVIDSDHTTYENILARRTLLPWPPGGLSVRVSWKWQGIQNLGTEVDVVASWACATVPSYDNLPAIEDARDL